MRFLLLLLSLFCVSNTVFSQTYFYKRVKIVKNGQTYNTQDDGHYMTIGKNCIYDSDAQGFCIGNSNMKYVKTENGILTYYGNTYFGSCYCFASSDYARLNIKDDETTYVYVRCTPSSGIALRPSTTNSGSAPINQTPSYTTPPSNNNTNTANRRQCPYCHGTGKGTEQIIWRTDYTGNQKDEYCSQCGIG